MPEIYLYRGAAIKGTSQGHRAPIFVDSADNAIKTIPAGSGSTQKTVAYVDSALTPASIAATGAIRSSSATASMGYATGAGAAVIQLTNRTTGVTIDTPTGKITTDTTSLAAEGTAKFTVTCAAVAIGDTVVVSQQSGSNSGGTIVHVTTVANGSFQIAVHNGNVAAGTAETGAIIINYAIIKGVAA